MNQKYILMAQMLAMMHGIEKTHVSGNEEETFEQRKDRIEGDPTNPYKKCKVCERLHRKHSSFCSDTCTRTHIQQKNKS